MRDWCFKSNVFRSSVRRSEGPGCSTSHPRAAPAVVSLLSGNKPLTTKTYLSLSPPRTPIDEPESSAHPTFPLTALEGFRFSVFRFFGFSVFAQPHRSKQSAASTSLHTLLTVPTASLADVGLRFRGNCLEFQVQLFFCFFFVLQHLYLGALYSLLALKSVLLDDFQAYYLGEIGS